MTSEICMRAKKYQDGNGKPLFSVVNWVMSEKYDGQRAIWDGKNLTSRYGNIILIPDWFRSLLELSDHPIDGELYFGRGKFGMTGIFRATKVDEFLWERAKFMIFDIPNPKLGKNLFERIEQLKLTVRVMSKNWSADRPLPIEVVSYEPVVSKKNIDEKFNSIVEAGGEGLILRNPYSLYEFGESSHILKYKPYQDSEAVIIGYNAGNGKFTGMLGSFTVRDLDNPKITYNVSGLNNEIRRNYKKTHPIGTVITVCYTELTAAKKPRFPRYKGIRADIPDTYKTPSVSRTSPDRDLLMMDTPIMMSLLSPASTYLPDPDEAADETEFSTTPMQAPVALEVPVPNPKPKIIISIKK